MNDQPNLILLDDEATPELRSLRAERVRQVRAQVAAGDYAPPVDLVAELLVPWLVDDTPTLVAS